MVFRGFIDFKSFLGVLRGFKGVLGISGCFCGNTGLVRLSGELQGSLEG